jgi:hypothetical protein
MYRSLTDQIIQGSFTDDESLSNAIKGQDVILSLVGPNTFTGPGDTFTRAYRLIFKLMREHEVSRIYALATFSVYDPLDEFSILRSLLVWFIWAVVHNAWMEFVGIGRVFEEEATDLDWTVFRVGWLVPGEGRETVAGYIGDGKIVLHVRRIEIARWLVDEVQKGAEDWIQQRPGLASGPKVKAE